MDKEAKMAEEMQAKLLAQKEAHERFKAEYEERMNTLFEDKIHEYQKMAGIWKILQKIQYFIDL